MKPDDIINNQTILIIMLIAILLITILHILFIAGIIHLPDEDRMTSAQSGQIAQQGRTSNTVLSGQISADTKGNPGRGLNRQGGST